MKKHIKIGLFVGTVFGAIQGQNIGQSIKERAQMVQQLITCAQSTLGCTADQAQRISYALQNLNQSLMPLLSTQFSKSAQAVQGKVNELQAMSSNLVRLTPERRSTFVSTAKKVALAAIALAGVAAAISFGRAITKRPAQNLENIYASYGIETVDDQGFIEAVVQKRIDGIRNYMQTRRISPTALSAAISIIDRDTNYPNKENLIEMISRTITEQPIEK